MLLLDAELFDLEDPSDGAIWLAQIEEAIDLYDDALPHARRVLGREHHTTREMERKLLEVRNIMAEAETWL